MTQLQVLLVLMFISCSLCIEKIQNEFNMKQTETIQQIKSFCANKTKNFCSPESLSYMRQVLERERLNKESEERKMAKIRL